MQLLLHGFARNNAARSDGSSATQTSSPSKIINKFISAILALALGITICPAAGLAYAAESENAGDGVASGAQAADSGASSSASSDGTDRVNEDVALDTSGSASGNSNEGSEADAGNGSESYGNSGDASSVNAPSKYTGSVNGQTSADVSLNGNATVGTIEYNGLAYTINEEDSATVSITGLASAKPTGDVQIPAQVMSGDSLYAVTGIKVPGLDEDANPYAQDLFDDAAKAPGVKTVSIPATVSQIDPAFFQLFPNATDIAVSTDSKTYTSYEGAVYSADLTQLILVPQGKGSLVLPQYLATVPAYVFSQCNKLSAITFSGSTGNDFLAVRNNCLYTSDYSTLLAVPAGLGASASIAPECTTIAEGAFYGNSALETIVVGGVVAEIASAGDVALGADGNALMSGSAIDGSTLPAFSDAIVANATVVINLDAEAEGDEAAALIEQAKAAWVAYGFQSFKEPAAPGTEITPAEGASGFAFTLLPDYTLSVRWEGSEPPAAIDIPDYGMIDGVRYTVSTIAESGFSNYTSLVTVDIPQTVTAICANAFELCTNLQTIRFDSVASIGAQAFANTALLSLVLPATVQQIGDNAFSNMKGATIVALGSIADNSEIALGAASGLNVYVPKGTEDSWDAGIPTLGNHIYPYGVELPIEPIELRVGETVNINDGGYIEAPGSIEANYAYKANPISINTEDGTIEAKQAGSTYISVSLQLTVDQVAVKGNISNEVKLTPASADGQEESDIVAVTQTISLASDTMSAVAYGSELSAQAEINPEDEIAYYSPLPIIDPETGNSVANTDMSKAGWSMTEGGALRIWSADGVRIGAVNNPANGNSLGMYWNSYNWDQSAQANAASGVKGVDLRAKVTSVDTTGIYAVATMNAWFQGSGNLADVSKFRMPKGVSSTDGQPRGTSDIRRMFGECPKIAEFPAGIDMSDANYSFGKNGSERYCALGFFTACTSLRSIGEGFRLPTSIERISEMFLGCSSLTDLGDFELPVGSDSKVHDVNAVFKGCKSLTKLPSGFTLADLTADKVTGYSGPVSMFYGCSSLTALPDGFRLPAAENKWNFTSMFEGCSSLAALPEGFELPVREGSDTERLRITNMFAGCDNLTYIPASFSLANVPDIKTNDGISQLDSMFAKVGFAKTDNYISWDYKYNGYTGTPVPYAEGDMARNTLFGASDTKQLAPSWASGDAKAYWKAKYGRVIDNSSEVRVMYYFPNEPLDPTKGFRLSSVAGLNAWGQPNLPSMDPVTGYRVQDWYTDPYYDNVFGFGTQLTKTTQLYAKFYPFSYDISFDAQGNVPASVSAVSRNPETASIQEGSPVPEPTGVTMVGYDLEGWYVGNVKWDFASDTVSRAVTLTARWVPIEFVVNLDYGDATLNGEGSDAPKQAKATITGSFVLPSSSDPGVVRRGHDISSWEHSDIWFDKVSVGAGEGWSVSAKSLIEAGHLSNSRREISFTASWTDSTYSVTLYAYGDKSASAVAPDAKLSDDVALSAAATGDAFKVEGSGEGYPASGYALTGWAASPDDDPMTAGKLPNSTAHMSDILDFVTGSQSADAPLGDDDKRTIELYAIWTPVYSATLPVGAADEASFEVDVAYSTATILADANVDMESRTRAELDIEAKSSPTEAEDGTYPAEAIFGDTSKASFDYRQKDGAADSTEDVAESLRVPFALDGKGTWTKVARLSASDDGSLVDSFGDLYLTYRDVSFAPDIMAGSLSKDWGEVARIEWRASMDASTMRSYIFASPADPRISGS